jgi:hypothetical protein
MPASNAADLLTGTRLIPILGKIALMPQLPARSGPDVKGVRLKIDD